MIVKVLFVCLGNICRSPMLEGAFIHLVEENGLQDIFEIDSAGTSAYHIGQSADARMMQVAKQNNIHLPSLARQITSDDLKYYDYILAMDSSNYTDIMELDRGDATAKIILMRDFDSERTHKDVPDPYYGGVQGFQEVFEIAMRCAESLLDHIREEKNI